MKVLYQVFLLASIAVFAYQADDSSCRTDLIKFWAGLTEPFFCECIDETGADPTLVDFWIHYSEYPDNCALKCAIRCFYIKMNLTDLHGNLKVDQLKAIIPLPDDVIDPILNECAPLTGADACDKMFNVDQCLLTSILDAACPNTTRHH